MHLGNKMILLVEDNPRDRDADLIRSYRLHANSYIRKPVDFEQFVGAVQQLGLYWMVLNRVPPRRSPSAM